MVKEIRLINSDKVALIDDEDYDRCIQYNWRLKDGYVYSSSRIDTHHEYLARFILKIYDSSIFADHKDRNPLNNQKENLRFCSRIQNNFNRKNKINGTSNYKGVHWHNRLKKWAVAIKGKHVGLYRNEEEAALVYDKLATELYGEFAYKNFPEISNYSNIKISPKQNTSLTKGVCYVSAHNKWQAYIYKNHTNKHLGLFNTEQEAIEARKKAEINARD